MAYNSFRMSTLHFMMLERSVVDPLASYWRNLAGTTLLRNGNVRRQHHDVSVWASTNLEIADHDVVEEQECSAFACGPHERIEMRNTSVVFTTEARFGIHPWRNGLVRANIGNKK